MNNNKKFIMIASGIVLMTGLIITGYRLTNTDDKEGFFGARVATLSQTPWTSNIDGGGYNLTNVGNVGIGTSTPPQTLTVQGTAGTDPFNVASSSGTSMLVVDKQGNLIVDTNTLYVDAVNNRIGINQSSPDEELTLLGEMKIKSDLPGQLLFTNRADTNELGRLGLSGTNFRMIGIGNATEINSSNSEVYITTSFGTNLTAQTDGQIKFGTTTSIWKSPDGTLSKCGPDNSDNWVCSGL